MAKVTGIGGVFFKCGEGSELAAWYQKNLGSAPTTADNYIIGHRWWSLD